MNKVLSYHPGQTATVILSVFNSNGELADGYGTPEVTSILFPTGAAASGLPLEMTSLATGLYKSQFALPTGLTAVGTYVVVVSYVDPDTLEPKNEVTEIVVSAPFGNFSVSPG